MAKQKESRHAWFGRLQKVDTRDHAHLMTRALPAKLPATGRKLWRQPPVLNQGPTPRCVEYSWYAFLAAGPVTNTKSLPWDLGREQRDERNLYHLCQQNDEWEGESYEGSSVRAGAKVLAAAGYVGEYLWEFTAAAVGLWLLKKGPVVIGVDWFETMEDTVRWRSNEWCRLRPDLNPKKEGGHATLLSGVDLEKRCPDGTIGAVNHQQSWGTGWGNGGRSLWSLADLDVLLKSSGEACGATEIKFKPKPTGVQP